MTTDMPSYKELLDALEGMVWQHCQNTGDGGETLAQFDSMSLHSNAEAIEVLIKARLLEQVGPRVGRRLFAKCPNRR